MDTNTSGYKVKNLDEQIHSINQGTVKQSTSISVKSTKFLGRNDC